MNLGLIRSQLYDRLNVSDGPIHEVIRMRASSKTRLFCNYLWCSYDEILNTDEDEIEEAIRAHESLNND